MLGFGLKLKVHFEQAKSLCVIYYTQSKLARAAVLASYPFCEVLTHAIFEAIMQTQFFHELCLLSECFLLGM